MFSRCLFITSSYSSRCLRTEKCCASTCFCARHHAVLDWNAFLHAKLLHQARDPIGSEDTHQIVLEREIEARGARVALAAGPAAELVVDTPRFVTLGADDVKTGEADHLVVL